MYTGRSKQDYLYYITKLTKKHNLDNISRTKAYQQFYMHFPEIQWALLASVVSRNAGWNMTDLCLPSYKEMLSAKEREQLFMTYERANWLIFSDAFPQLLIYKLSRKFHQPLFHLLKKYHVSSYMINEWFYFWETGDRERLMIALIINEQNVIQEPVINQSYFKHHVFLRLPYLLQDFLMMNAVLIPTRSPSIYGKFVHDFTKISKRIELGKNLASIIFSKDVYSKLMDFITFVEHTGSRIDYERFLNINPSNSPFLRMVFPVITHQDKIRKDWYKFGGVSRSWVLPVTAEPKKIGEIFYKKRHLLSAYYHIKLLFK
ncbi:DUF2515 domain-containing protein [Ornithinibacillus sp. L9]|uniref:DUF2515 domain-containing protein n=1 Tax=Ornithinibacillus caprae TaxID=2678566 RepID=A0A6N8FHS3_9BACI|nr:DUF2515 family protein [Ornithinibacillus caprae]MUK87299.1 DUF2515 domain-containing protein [Ornithinibacillus caprae]